MNRQFNEVAVEDGTVFFSVPVDEAALDAVRDVDDVDRVESVVSVAATATNSNDTSQSYASLLEVYDTDTQVHGFDDPLPSSGMVAGHALADSIGVEEGDSVRIEITDLDVSFETTIASFVDEPLSTVFYISPDALEEIAAGADPGTAEAIRAAVSSPVFTFAKALYADGADGGVVTEEIRGIDIVAAAVDGGAMRDTVNDLQAFFYVFVGMMLLFGGAMAFALIFNIISVNVAEREGEFASMRANGLTHRRIANLIMGETFLLVAFGIIPGLIAGYLAAAALMNSYSSDQFPISLSMNWYTYVASAVAMFVVAWLSLLPALRSVKRINVGEVVRERST
jgi:putative ABC transport system permease protein